MTLAAAVVGIAADHIVVDLCCKADRKMLAVFILERRGKRWTQKC
jgi:hypothetical protein